MNGSFNHQYHQCSRSVKILMITGNQNSFTSNYQHSSVSVVKTQDDGDRREKNTSMIAIVSPFTCEVLRFSMKLLFLRFSINI